MFKEIGLFTKLLGALPKMKEEAEKMQQRLGQIVVEGDAGGGMVKATVNGRLELLRLDISQEAYQGEDREFLEDLIRGAVNQALDKARAQVGEETGKLAGQLGLPGMPDLSQLMGS